MLNRGDRIRNILNTPSRTLSNVLPAAMHRELRSKLLELGEDAIRHARHALGEQAIHQRLEDVELQLNREIDEVGIQ